MPATCSRASTRAPTRRRSTRRSPRRRRTRRTSPTRRSTSPATRSSRRPPTPPRSRPTPQKATVAQLEAQVQQDQAQIDNARTQLSYTTITAPIDGRTGMRQVDPATSSMPADATGIVIITTLQPISVRVHPAAAGAAVGRGSDAGGPGRRCWRWRRAATPGDAGPRHAHRAGQPGRSDDRHHQAQGHVPQSRPQALAGRVRRRAAEGRDGAQRGRGAARRRAARTARSLYLCGQAGQHGRRAGR